MFSNEKKEKSSKLLIHLLVEFFQLFDYSLGFQVFAEVQLDLVGVPFAILSQFYGASALLD